MRTRRSNVLLPVETKPVWKYKFLQAVDANTFFPDSFEVPNPAPPHAELPEDWSDNKKKVFHLVRQICGQMKSDTLRYGCFHIYSFWWFCELTTECELKISRRFNGSETSPSVLQGLRTIIGMDSHRINGVIETHAQSPIKKCKKNDGSSGNAPGSADNLKDGDGGNTHGDYGSRKPSANRGRTRRGGNKGAGKNKSISGGAKSRTSVREKENSLANSYAEIPQGTRKRTPPRACDVFMWECTLLDSLTGVKILSTSCGSGFVKMVRDPRAAHAVSELEQEATVYQYVQEKDPISEAAPAFFGISDHLGVPLIVLSMEGPSFEEIGSDHLSNELKESAIKSLGYLSSIGILHGDIALRNVVQSKSNTRKAKIIDFGRASMCSDQTLLQKQVEVLRRLMA